MQASNPGGDFDLLHAGMAWSFTDGKKGDKEGKNTNKQEKQSKQEAVYTAGDEEITGIRGRVTFIYRHQETRRRKTLPPGREGGGGIRNVM